MLPLMVVGGVIGAVVSAIQGASWLSDQLGPSNAASVGGKGGVQAQADAKASPFEATLTAQVAGQAVPASATSAVTLNSPTLSADILPVTHSTDYAALARLNAGLAAYSHVGTRHGNHAGAAKQPAAHNEAVIRS
jgi:hypothetical protein